jgi:hypothetical protein
VNLLSFIFNAAINYADSIGLASIIQQERCSVSAIFGHYRQEWKLPPSGDQLEFGVCQYIGIFTCYADDDNSRIADPNRIRFPGIPGKWPPLRDGETSEGQRIPWDKVDYERALRELSGAWCGVLKSIESCCSSKEEVPLTEDQKRRGKKPEKKWCCPDGCTVSINYDTINRDFEGILDRLRAYLNTDPELARQFADYGCEGLNDTLRRDYWGDGLPPDRSGRPRDIKGPGNICERLR